MLSMKAKYGLRAAIYMAKNPDVYLQARTIAENADVPLKFLEAILLELRHKQLVETRRGVQGGYKLTKTADDITAGQIIRVLDGMLAPIKCASQFKYEPCEDCRDPVTCDIRHMMTEVRTQIAGILDQRRLSDFVSDHEKQGVHDVAI